MQVWCSWEQLLRTRRCIDACCCNSRQCAPTPRRSAAISSCCCCCCSCCFCSCSCSYCSRTPPTNPPPCAPGARPKGDTTPLQQRALATDLPPQRLLAVLDHLLCLEAAWHSGGALARTVYSSLYMMQPDRCVCVLSVLVRGVRTLVRRVQLQPACSLT
jgi:hypothetical protein